MKNEIYIDEIIDGYIKGNQTYEVTEMALQQELIDNPVQLINLHRTAVLALQRNAVMEQVSKVHNQFVALSSNGLSTVSQNATSKARVVKLNPAKWMMRVAAVLVLMAGGWFYYQYNKTSSSGLYAEMYQPYNVNTDRALITDIVPHNMVQQFKEKNYTAVIQTFKTLATTNNREKFLTAIAYHETTDYSASLNLLLQIVSDNNKTGSRLYSDEAEFYIGLSYLKLKNAKEAAPWFEKIRNNPSHTFHERVSKWVMTRLKWIK